MINLSVRLKELRGPTSQSDMAKSIGIPQQAWARYEKGLVAPNAETLYNICSVHACSADWLLGLTDTQRNSPQTVNAPNNKGAIAIGGGNAVSRDCMECPLLKDHLKRFSRAK